MSNVVFHSNESESNRQFHKEFDNVDFLINVGQGRALVKNSVRLCGNLRVNSVDNPDPSTGTRATEGIEFNRNGGIHCMIGSLQVQFTEGDRQGNIENIDNYNRYCVMNSVASEDKDDLFNGKNICELKAPNQKVIEQYCIGTKTRNTTGTQYTDDVSFSIKPKCCLNNMDLGVQSGNLPYNKSGAIKLTFNLAKNNSCLFGGKQTILSGYSLNKLKITYMSVPVENPNPCRMRLVHNYKGAVLSSFSNISAKVPAVCDSVVMCFQEQRRENVVIEDNLQLDKPNNIKEVQYLFNDSNNEFITYKMDDKGEMLERFTNAMSKSGHSELVGGRLNGDGAFGLGLDFRNFVDLSNNKFNVQLNSDIDGTNPYNVYMYFSSVISV